jgi:flagellar hook-associated protein 3 FlgL
MKELTTQMETQLDNSYSDLSNVQNELSTGKRLLKPSDNPVDTANDIKLKTQLAEETQYHTNIQDGINFMNVSDTAMQSMETIMQRLRELAVEGSSDTLSASDRTNMQPEVDQLFRQLVSLTNTQYNGAYVFGGTQNNIEPFPVLSSTAASPADYTGLKMAYFDGSGGVNIPAQIKNGFDNSSITNILPGSFKLSIGNVNYVEGTDYTVNYVNGTITPLNAALAANMSPGTPNYAAGALKMTFDYVSKGKDVFGNTVGNNGNVMREIANGVTSPINISGDQLTVNSQTGTDMMSTMIAFEQNLLNNNTQGINTAISQIDNVNQAVSNSQTQNGARINRFTTTLTQNENQNTQTTGLISNLEDADMADAATKFSLMNTVYDAALKSASMTMQHSLADYL